MSGPTVGTLSPPEWFELSDGTIRHADEVLASPILRADALAVVRRTKSQKEVRALRKILEPFHILHAVGDFRRRVNAWASERWPSDLRKTHLPTVLRDLADEFEGAHEMPPSRGVTPPERVGE